MDPQSLVVEILEEVFPDEYDIAGPANVRRLAARTGESVRVDGGSSLDMAQVLNELQAVVVILYASISILHTLTRSAHGPVSVVTAQATAEESIPEFSRLDPKKRDAIIDRVVRWVNEDPAARVPWPSHPADELQSYAQP
jgi:hypothetical protein